MLAANRWEGYLVAGLGIAAVSSLLAPFKHKLNSTTVGFALSARSTLHRDLQGKSAGAPGLRAGDALFQLLLYSALPHFHY